MKNYFKTIKNKVSSFLRRRYQNYTAGQKVYLQDFTLSYFPRFLLLTGEKAFAKVEGQETENLTVSLESQSDDYSKNWVHLKREEFSYPLPFQKYGALGLNIFSDGTGGILKIVLEDETGTELEYEDRECLKYYGWQEVIYPLKLFQSRPWNKKGKSKVIKKLKNYSLVFSFQKGKKSFKLSRVFFIENKPYLLSYTCILDNLPPDWKSYMFPLLKKREFSQMETYQGSDSKLEFGEIERKDFLGMMLEGRNISFRINSNDFSKNYLSLVVPLDFRHLDYSRVEGLILPLKVRKSGGELKIIFEDTEGKKVRVDIVSPIQEEGDYLLWIPKDRWQLVGGIPHKIKKVEFYLGLHWKKAPLSGEIFLFSPWVLGKEEVKTRGKLLLEEFYFQDFPRYHLQSSSGVEGEFKIKKGSWGGEAGSLYLKFKNTSSAGKIEFSRKNYFHSLPLFSFGGIVFKCNFSGNVDKLKFFIVTSEGKKYVCEDREVIPGVWMEKSYTWEDFSAFSEKSPLPPSDLKSYGIEIEVSWKGIFICEFSDIGLLGKDSISLGYQSFIDYPSYRVSAYNLPFSWEGINYFNYNEFIHYISGEEAIFSIDWEDDKKIGDWQGKKLKFSFTSSDTSRSYASIRTLQLKEAVLFRSLKGLLLGIEVDKGQGGSLEIVFEDKKGRTGKAYLKDIFLGEGRRFYWVDKKNIWLQGEDLEEIVALELHFFPSLYDVEVENEVYFFPPIFMYESLPRLNFKDEGEKEVVPVIDKEIPVVPWGLERARIYMELTNLCNLKCNFCIHGSWECRRERGVMQESVFRKIIQELSEGEYGLWELNISGWGDPGLHPQIKEFLNILSNLKRNKDRSVISVVLQTNGMALDKLEEGLDLSSVDYLVFSFGGEGFLKSNYYSKVVNRMEALKQQGKREETLPILVIQGTFQKPEDEKNVFVDFWRKKGFTKIKDETSLHQYSLWDYSKYNEDFIYLKKAFSKGKKVDKVTFRPPCRNLWKSLLVFWDGRVTPCFWDVEGKLEIGDIRKSNLSDIWLGEDLLSLRLGHILGNYEGCKLCENCLGWQDNYLTDREVEAYLYSINREYLWDEYIKRKK